MRMDVYYLKRILKRIYKLIFILFLLYLIFRCPVDPSIFPSFGPDGNALQSVYEAFRFTESYGVIFQCNVKYCLGPCEPVCKLINIQTKKLQLLIVNK